MAGRPIRFEKSRSRQRAIGFIRSSARRRHGRHGERGNTAHRLADPRSRGPFGSGQISIFIFDKLTPAQDPNG